MNCNLEDLGSSPVPVTRYNNLLFRSCPKFNSLARLDSFLVS